MSRATTGLLEALRRQFLHGPIRLWPDDSQPSLSAPSCARSQQLQVLSVVFGGETMFRTIVGLGAALALASGVAAAQDASKYVDQRGVISAQMSPGGQEVAFIRRTEDLQQLLITNLASKQTRSIQTVK